MCVMSRVPIVGQEKGERRQRKMDILTLGLYLLAGVSIAGGLWCGVRDAGLVVGYRDGKEEEVCFLRGSATSP